MYIKLRLGSALPKPTWTFGRGSHVSKFLRGSVAPIALGAVVLYFLVLISAVADRANEASRFL